MLDYPMEFRTLRLSGQPPAPRALSLYKALFGAAAEGMLDRDIQDYGRHRIAPWPLSHAGRAVGVGGFRIGFGHDGREVVCQFLPDAGGEGLASEYLASALDHGRIVLRGDRFFGRVARDNAASLRVMAKAGFVETGAATDDPVTLRLR